MVKIAIVEDSINDRNLLSGYLDRYSKEKGVELKVFCFSSGDIFLASMEGKYDVLLLDIEMPGLNGLEVAKKIRETDNKIIIAFITGLAQYAIEGYYVDACAYILKPYIYEDFVMKFARILSLANQKNENVITINGKGIVYNVFASDIYYIEVFRHYLTYHTTKGDYISRDSMTNVEEKMKNYSFFRINNAFLINLKHVDKIEKDDVYINNYPLKISRQKKRDFLKEFARYYGGK